MALGMLGKYERLDVLGRGVSGIVYLARDTMLNKQVALKEVDVQSGDVRRFLEEARVMDRMRHPNIVRVNGVDRIDGKVVIDMEYVRGSNLQELLRANGPFTIGKALDIAIQVLDALHYAHRMQTVHRDIKPANILVDRDGVAKLADFGLAEILTTNAYAGGAGTYAYMAPEDFLEENHSDAQSDIWAVGVTLFEMLTGQRPFFAANTRSPFAWKRALETQSPTPLNTLLPGAPGMLNDCLLKALERDKEARYLTAGEFLRDLQQVRSELTPDEARLGVGAEAVALSDPGAGNAAEAEEATHAAFQSNLDAQTAPAPSASPVVDTPSEDQRTVTAVPRRRFALFNRNAPATITASSESVQFGALRMGDARTARINLKVSNLTGSSRGQIRCTSRWLNITPSQFDAARQSVELIADGEQFYRPGDYDDVVTVESAAGTLEIPVYVSVIPARKRFSQIALWYLPLFIIAFLPAGVSAILGANHPSLAPPAAASTLGLELMLLLVSCAADAGIPERLACIVVSAWMAVVLGIQENTANSIHYVGPLTFGLHWAGAAGVCMGGLILVQLGTYKSWKWWAAVVGVVGTGIAGLCWSITAGR
jgi:eukaryotic-like serine/threonine-protein kinase